MSGRFRNGSEKVDKAVPRTRPIKTVRINNYEKKVLSLQTFPNLDEFQFEDVKEKVLINSFILINTIKSNLDKVISTFQEIENLSRDEKEKKRGVFLNLIEVYNKNAFEFNKSFDSSEQKVFLIEEVENLNLAILVTHLRKIQDIQIFISNLHADKFPNSIVYEPKYYK